jgi:nucleoside-diphosphate kinase
MYVHNIPREIIAAHYEEHEGKPYYLPMIEYFTGKTVVSAVYQELYPESRIVEEIRGAIGVREPAKAELWTIRGKYGGGECDEIVRAEGRKVLLNIIHASDSRGGAGREIEIWGDGLFLPGVFGI